MTIQHLLLHCVVAREAWFSILHEWGLLEWMSSTGMGMVEWWTSRSGREASQRDIWTMLILCLWCIWRHRNDVVFEGGTPQAITIVEKVRQEKTLWRQARLIREGHSGALGR